MKRRWLWLEDQIETVADFRADIERLVEVEIFSSISDLVRRLLSAEPPEYERIGLILDVMLINNPWITCPPSWSGGEKPVYFKTRQGYDAGIAFYEAFMLPNEKVSTPRIQPPPPVVFLTVTHQDMEELESRFTRLRQEWGKAHGMDANDSKVEWVRKWDANGKKLGQILLNWEKD